MCGFFNAVEARVGRRLRPRRGCAVSRCPGPPVFVARGPFCPSVAPFARSCPCNSDNRPCCRRSRPCCRQTKACIFSPVRPRFAKCGCHPRLHPSAPAPSRPRRRTALWRQSEQTGARERTAVARRRPFAPLFAGQEVKHLNAPRRVLPRRRKKRPHPLYFASRSMSQFFGKLGSDVVAAGWGHPSKEGRHLGVRHRPDGHREGGMAGAALHPDRGWTPRWRSSYGSVLRGTETARSATPRGETSVGPLPPKRFSCGRDVLWAVGAMAFGRRRVPARVYIKRCRPMPVIVCPASGFLPGGYVHQWAGCGILWQKNHPKQHILTLSPNWFFYLQRITYICFRFSLNHETDAGARAQARALAPVKDT